MTQASLTLSNLEVAYGDIRALTTVTLEVPWGTHVTLLGPSGAGKSTLLRAVAGLVAPATGSVRWGQDYWSDAQRSVWVPPEQRRIGMVAQDPALWPNLTAAEHLALALRWRGVHRSARPARIDELLKQVRLTGRAGHRPAGLSGGEAQRLAVARALAGGSRLLLLDEPLGQLDAELRPAMAAEIRQIAGAARATVLHVTHDPAEALSLGDLVVVLEGGRLIQSSRPAELTERPRTRFVAWATGHRNLVPPHARQTLCHALGLDAADPPFAILEDGTAAFNPCRLRLAEAAAGAGLAGQVTGANYDGSRWMAVVRVSLSRSELDLHVTASAPPPTGSAVKLVWRPPGDRP